MYVFLEENEKQVEYMINELGMKLIPIEKQDGMSDGFVDGTIRMYPLKIKVKDQLLLCFKKTTETENSKEKILNQT